MDNNYNLQYYIGNIQLYIINMVFRKIIFSACLLIYLFIGNRTRPITRINYNNNIVKNITKIGTDLVLQ